MVNEFSLPIKPPLNLENINFWTNINNIYDAFLLHKGFRDENKLKQGLWEYYYPNNIHIQLHSKGIFKNDLKQGHWEEYFENGEFNFREFYFNH